jgi:hypothetical protein
MRGRLSLFRGTESDAALPVQLPHLLLAAPGVSSLRLVGRISVADGVGAAR